MPSEEDQISNEIKIYTEHLESLYITLPQTMVFLQEAHEKFEKDFDNFVSQNCHVTYEDEKEKTIEISEDLYKSFKDKKYGRDRLETARRLVPRSFLISMVSQYDAYLGKLLKSIFTKKPELLNNSAKSYNYSDISKFKSMEEFKEYAINKEIEGIIRESHSKQFDIMQEKFSLKLKENLHSWPKFIEITERRNLFVHSDGIVSKQYINVCKDHKCDIGDACEGSKLNVSHKYFKEAHKCLYEIGVKLGQVLWRKIFPDESELSDINFCNITYDLIERKQYNLACDLLDMAIRDWDKKFSTDYRKSLVIINCAQSHKWAGRSEKCIEILRKHDWSAKGLEFKIAEAVLLEKWTDAATLMKQIGREGPVSKVAYRDWPLFREFRENEQFKVCYLSIFSESFGSEQVTEKVEEISPQNLLGNEM
jgi:hypothetical protein